MRKGRERRREGRKEGRKEGGNEGRKEEMHLTALFYGRGQNNGRVLDHKPCTCIGTFSEKFNTTFVLPETQW